MSSDLPRIYLLTCPKRAAMCAETLARWARTDWPGLPRVHDSGEDAGAVPGVIRRGGIGSRMRLSGCCAQY